MNGTRAASRIRVYLVAINVPVKITMGVAPRAAKTDAKLDTTPVHGECLHVAGFMQS